jgi:hypothetical protein
MNKIELNVSGLFLFEQWRNGACIAQWQARNGVVTVGANLFLDTMFNGVSPSPTWYVGLYVGTGTLSNADTMSSHGGWTEFTSYSESTRQAWVPSSAGARAVPSASASAFHIAASGTLKGAFLVNNSSKGGVSGTLYCTAAFSIAASVIAGDYVSCTYRVAIA